MTNGAPSSRPQLTRSPKRVPMPELGVVVFESQHAPGFYGELKDSYSKFHLLIAGRAQWESEGRVYRIAADTLFHIAAQVPHFQKDLPNAPVTLYAIHYRTELLRSELARALATVGMLPVNLGGARANQAKQVRGIVQEMLFEQEEKRFGWEALLVSRLTDLAVLALRMHRGETPSVDGGDDSAGRVTDYLARLKSEFYLPVTLDDAARSASLSRRQFTELFRKATGQSWRRYVNGMRLEYAAKLLRNTARSVTAICFECGFDDLSHFHHSFKAEFGKTPLEFRSAENSTVHRRDGSRRRVR